MGKQDAPWKSTDAFVGSPDDESGSGKPSSSWANITAAALPSVASMALRTVLGVTLALYVLNQKHALPRPLSAVVSKTLFWPTLPITVSRRLGKWMTRVDDTVVMGGAPFGFLNYPDKLYEEYGVCVFSAKYKINSRRRLGNSQFNLLFLIYLG